MSVLKIQPNELVQSNGKVYRIKQILTFDSVYGLDEETNQMAVLLIKDLVPPANTTSTGSKIKKIVDSSEKACAVMEVRSEVVQPLIDRKTTKELIATQGALAVRKGILKKGHRSTMFRLRNKLQQGHNKNDLLPLKHTGGEGKCRLNDDRKKLMEDAIESEYLTSQNKNQSATIEAVQVAFELDNRTRTDGKRLKVPCDKTIRKAIDRLNKLKAMEIREGKDKAKAEYGVDVGKIETGKWPWDIIQVDHTQLNIFAIDPQTKETLWRPWITAAIDTFSRVILAFVISFCKPSASTLALCYSMAMLPKEMWLEQWGLLGDEFRDLYPVWGRPGFSLFDNALEHESNALKEGMRKNLLSYEFRCLGKKEEGAFIESFFRTLKNEVAKWPGTTFHGPDDRDNYNSEKMATMSLLRIELAIANWILRIYHYKKHKGLGGIPIDVYKKGLLESGIGLPDKLYGKDATELALSFMPYDLRVIQRGGIELDGQWYVDSVLKEYRTQTTTINNQKHKKLFMIKRVPMDISSAYLFDENLNEHLKIPNKDPNFPSISLPEYDYIRKLLKQNEIKVNNENIIRARIDINQIIRGSSAEKQNILRGLKKARSKADDSRNYPEDKSEEVRPADVVPQNADEDLTPVEPFDGYKKT